MANLASEIEKKIIEHARNEWPDDLTMQEYTIEKERNSYVCLQTSPSDIPADVFAECVMRAKADFECFEDQWFGVETDLRTYRYVRQVREQLGPIQELVIKMEQIIGSEFYNARMQNYGPGGIWQGEGRKYRYPVTFREDGKNRKAWHVSKDMPAEHLVTGVYRVGSNELNIFRALVRVVDMLQKEFGLEVVRKSE